ncbi:ATP-binding protein [Nonomuraea jiangxiensis]|nr:BTAD domain-containing putative transcriptional regulator [Nonomuraea jiangxiensis]
MGDTLTVLLLGTPELAVGGVPVGIRSAKTRALLCYLATAPGPRPRGELATLLWGERPDTHARGSLRLALSELRREVGGWLDIGREQVGFRADDTSFVDHRQLTRELPVAGVLRLWRGEFLDGVSFGDAPAFAGWLDAERGRVRSMLREVLVGAATAGSACPEQLVRLARIVTDLDPFDEEAHRLLIASLAEAGNRAAALACYEDLRRRLAAELGVDPAPETRALRQALLPRPGHRRAGPPVPGTELIGRAAEVRHLRELLSRERLVTLVGPGGIGKTRLAIAATARTAGAGDGERGQARNGDGGRGPARNGDGARGPARDVAFVSFAGVGHEAAVTTLARRLGVDLTPPRPALDLLLATLSARSTLLVLDNLEHLPAFDAVIARIMEAAPGVGVLATSRRRPDLPGQVIVEVTGLPAPAAEELFTVRALKAQPSFDPDREAALVAAICAATCGLPLAIELAASLLRAVPCAELAQRLGVDPGLLSAPGPAARSRHACMRTVFETSWRLLDPAGQEALAALSVFGGGCTLRAALEVARTSPEVLVRLVDHSMIHLTPAGRYAIHPLIQQFAAAHLDRTVRRRHAAHFARLLDRHAAALEDASDTEVTRVLAPELDNIRLAWAASGQPRFLDHYWALCLRLRLYEESGAIVRRHLARTREAPHLRARRLWMAAVSEHQLAREGEAIALARAALDTVGRPLPTSSPGRAVALVGAAAGRLLPVRRADAAGAEAAQALTLLARLAFLQRDLPTMLLASLRQLNAAEQATDPALRAEAYANFATIARIARLHRLADRYGALTDHALAGISHPTAAANRARLARGLDQLFSGAFEAARHSFAEGRARTPDPRMAESCAGMLAETALWRGDFGAAVDLYAETEELAVARVGGDDIGRYWCLMGRVEALLRLDGVAAGRIAEVLAAAWASTERRRTHARELGLRDSAALHVIQRMRLLTAGARLDPASGGPAVREALALARRLPPAQHGLLECWTGLAELLPSLDPDPGTARFLHSRMTRFVSRNPGAVARIGWARALVLATAGRQRAARRVAGQAMADAERLSVPYDYGRAEQVALALRGG